MNNSGKVCAISGGTSGVGLSTAIRFAREGWSVAVCGRHEARLKSAGEAILQQSTTGKVLAVICDMTDPEQSGKFISDTVDAFSRLDVLVNNAAAAPLGELDTMSDETIDHCIDLNIRGVYYATRAAWTIFREQKSGIVVNISSQAAVDPFPGFSLYGSTKAWIELFTVALANEGKALGIRSYCMRPGAIETPMLRGLFADFPADQCVAPDDVAETIWTACGPGLENSSGQIIKVSRQ